MYIPGFKALRSNLLLFIKSALDFNTSCPNWLNTSTLSNPTGLLIVITSLTGFGETLKASIVKPSIPKGSTAPVVKLQIGESVEPAVLMAVTFH